LLENSLIADATIIIRSDEGPWRKSQGDNQFAADESKGRGDYRAATLKQGSAFDQNC
jgi:hypothetical protein